MSNTIKITSAVVAPVIALGLMAAPASAQEETIKVDTRSGEYVSRVK